MNKTTEALKLAEEALQDCMEKFYAMKSTGVIGALPSQAVKAAATLAAIREALAEPQITTPDVCGEVCARSKLCYGCGKAFDEALAEPVKQEPVAFMFKVKRTTAASTVLDEFAAIDYFPQDNEEIVSKEPLSYAAPVDAKAIRAEAYQQGRDDMKEEAAKVCDGIERSKWEILTQGGKLEGLSPRDCAAAIRGLR